MEDYSKLTRAQRYRLRKKGIAVPFQRIGALKGYKQTREHVEARIRRGENHYAWAGDQISEKGGRARAKRLFRSIGNCVDCGSLKSERHHNDGNTANNSPENIVPLCRRCHMLRDGRLEAFRELARSNQPKAVEARWNKSILRG